MKKRIKKLNNECGLTLLEIVVTFILAALVGSMLVEYMGTSLTRGGEPVMMVQDGFSLNSVMEKITADYEYNYKAGNYPTFDDFKTKIQNGNISTNTPYYGDYTVLENGYTAFNASGSESPDGSDDLLKVTIGVGTQSVTVLFRK